MAKVNLVTKKVTMDQRSIIKFQLMIYCYFQGFSLSDSELECLVLLALNNEADISDFCNASCKESERDREPNLPYVQDIYANPQVVRNYLNKMERMGLIIKEGRNRKKIYLSADIQLQALGNILLDYKFIHVEPQEI
jgi:hypothetical protein